MKIVHQIREIDDILLQHVNRSLILEHTPGYDGSGRDSVTSGRTDASGLLLVQRQIQSRCSSCWSPLGNVDCSWEGQSIAHTTAFLTQDKHNRASRPAALLLIQPLTRDSQTETSASCWSSSSQVLCICTFKWDLSAPVRTQADVQSALHVWQVSLYFGCVFVHILVQHSSPWLEKLLWPNQSYWIPRLLWLLVWKWASAFRWLNIRLVWHLPKAFCLLQSHYYQSPGAVWTQVLTEEANLLSCSAICQIL